MTDAPPKIEEQLSKLFALSTRIDTQTSEVRRKIDALEGDVKSLMKAYSEIHTQVELVKQSKDYPHLNAELEKVKNKIELIEEKQLAHTLEISALAKETNAQKNKWEKVVDTLYKVIVAIVSAVIIYNMGIKE